MQGLRLLGSLTVDTLGGALDTLGIGHWTLYSIQCVDTFGRKLDNPAKTKDILVGHCTVYTVHSV